MTARRRSFRVLAAALESRGHAGGLAARERAMARSYENGTDLVLPADYRAWPFIGAGLGMTYDGERGTQAASPDNPRFTHAFVNPSAYAHFMRTGSWPDGTVFMLEFRASQTEGSINRAGRFATRLTFLEAEVKDARFADGWAFYAFGPGDRLARVAKPLAGDGGRALRRVPFRARRRRADVRAVLSALARSRAREGHSQAGPLSRAAAERVLAGYAASRMMWPTPVDDAGT